MSNTERMTSEEIHDFGVEIVARHLEKEGHEIKDLNSDLGKNPQIVAEKDGRLFFIAVRTACYPEKGKLEDFIHFQMLEHADKHHAIPYFASVGIANAEAKTEAEMSVPN